MRKLIFQVFAVIAMLSFSNLSTAQVVAPDASPSAKFTQMVGLTEISVSYYRPGVKGRTIFAEDGLVPYGKIWRTGANAATKISFSDDVNIGGKALSAGSYAILTKPMANAWEVMLFPYEASSFGSYVEKEPAATLSAEVSNMGAVTMENFMIMIDGLTNNSAMLHFIWDNTAASLPITVNTDDKVMASIDNTMSGPAVNDYFRAASYYLAEGKDLKMAHQWITKANADAPRYWMLRTQALIEAELGMTTEAIATAKKSLDMAKEAGNMDYVRMNEKSLAEWEK